MAKHDRSAGRNATTAPTPWRREVVFVCKKCSGRFKGDLTPDGTLRDWLKHRLKADGLRHDIRVVETGCFGLCPKGAVTLATGAMLADPANGLLAVDRDTDLDALYATLIRRAA